MAAAASVRGEHCRQLNCCNVSWGKLSCHARPRPPGLWLVARLHTALSLVGGRLVNWLIGQAVNVIECHGDIASGANWRVKLGNEQPRHFTSVLQFWHRQWQCLEKLFTSAFSLLKMPTTWLLYHANLWQCLNYLLDSCLQHIIKAGIAQLWQVWQGWRHLLFFAHLRNSLAIFPRFLSPMSPDFAHCVTCFWNI